MSLNVQEIKGFRAADKSYKKYGSRGLLLLVKPNGSKLWYFKYRFGGKEKKLPIGAFPEVSLSQARQLRDRARLKVPALPPCAFRHGQAPLSPPHHAP